MIFLKKDAFWVLESHFATTVSLGHPNQEIVAPYRTSSIGRNIQKVDETCGSVDKTPLDKTSL